MTTITAKELRDNLRELTRRVRAGEHIYVSYRNQPAFKLEPINSKPNQEPSAQARPGLQKLLEYQKNNSKKFKNTDNRPIKELYHESLMKKYGKYVE